MPIIHGPTVSAYHRRIPPHVFTLFNRAMTRRTKRLEVAPVKSTIRRLTYRHGMVYRVRRPQLPRLLTITAPRALR